MTATKRSRFPLRVAKRRMEAAERQAHHDDRTVADQLDVTMTRHGKSMKERTRLRGMNVDGPEHPLHKPEKKAKSAKKGKNRR